MIRLLWPCWYRSFKGCVPHLTGLKLVLNSGQDEYVEALSAEAGARVVINSQNQMPFPEDQGFFVKPGYSTSIGMKKVKISLKGRIASP